MISQLLIALTLLFPFSLVFCEPDASDVATAQSSEPTDTSPSSEPKFIRPDIRTDQANWEHSSGAMYRTLQYVEQKLSRKYPPREVVNSKGRQLFVHNKINFELIQNITPEGLNTPDTSVQQSYYTPQQHGVIAVFAVKVKIISTVVAEQGSVYQVKRLMGHLGVDDSSLPESQENQQKTDTKLYLVSMPREPFHRMLVNPLANPIAAELFKAGGMEIKQPEIPHKELKALFPSNRAVMKKIAEEDLNKILSGDFIEPTEDE